MTGLSERIAAALRPIPNFPRPGILFQDVTPVLADDVLFADTVVALSTSISAYDPTHIAGIEARGFIFGAAVAARLGLGFVPIRKPGRLPGEVATIRYELEYGTDGLEVHQGILPPGAKIVIVDDVLATGGTAAAAAQLVRMIGGSVAAWSFVIELRGLGGRIRLSGAPIDALTILHLSP